MLPPYGKNLVQHLTSFPNSTFAIQIYVGKFAFETAIHWGNKGQQVLCLPPNANITQYDWPVKNKCVYLVDTGGISLQELKRMCAFLMAQGAVLVDMQPYIEGLDEIFLNSKK